MDRWDTALVFSKNNDMCSYQVLDSGPWVSGVFFFSFFFGEGRGEGGMVVCIFSHT